MKQVMKNWRAQSSSKKSRAGSRALRRRSRSWSATHRASPWTVATSMSAQTEMTPVPDTHWNRIGLPPTCSMSEKMSRKMMLNAAAEAQS